MADLALRLDLPRPSRHAVALGAQLGRLALDLLDKMLRFCPEKRITVAEALRHPYLASLHDDDCEPVAPAPFAFDFEEEDLRENALRNRVYEEMELYHSGAAAGVDSTGAATAMES